MRPCTHWPDPRSARKPSRHLCREGTAGRNPRAAPLRTKLPPRARSVAPLADRFVCQACPLLPLRSHGDGRGHDGGRRFFQANFYLGVANETDVEHVHLAEVTSPRSIGAYNQGKKPSSDSRCSRRREMPVSSSRRAGQVSNTWCKRDRKPRSGMNIRSSRLSHVPLPVQYGLFPAAAT